VNKLEQLYEHHVTTRCMKGLTFEQLLLDAFDQLAPFYASERTTTRSRVASSEVGASYAAIKAKLSTTTTEEHGVTSVRMLPAQLTPQALGTFLGAQNACWILEDFHKIDAAEKVRLSQMMKVFMDLSDEYPTLKIVALGAVDTARQVVDYDPEMRNRVAEVHVALMTEKEIEAIIAKGEKALNVSFHPDVRRTITRHSNGLASVCHHLCLNMCDAAGVTDTVEGSAVDITREHCSSALKTYVEEASDSIKGAFDKALKKRRKTQYSNAELIIDALAAFSDMGAARMDLCRKIREREPKFPEANLKYMLPRLCTSEYGSVLRHDSDSGKYSFSDPIYRVFALAKNQGAAPLRANQDVERMLVRLLMEKIDVQKIGAVRLRIDQNEE
jgi:hypothetical protein